MPKTVFISGASAGFGAACARRFAREGWRVVAAARRIAQLEALKAECGGTNVYTLELDVRDRKSVEILPDKLPAEFRQVDVLVNNAGLALGLSSTHEGEIEDWETMIDTNVKGLLYLTRMILPGMVERKCGHVINIGSVAGDYAYPGGNVYAGTKAFVNHFSRNMRCDLLGTKVRVTSIEPGLAETEFSLVRFRGDAVRAGKPYQNKKPLVAEDIAEAVYWVTTLPEHVNINKLEMMPTCQAWGPFKLVEEGA